MERLFMENRKGSKAGCLKQFQFWSVENHIVLSSVTKNKSHEEGNGSGDGMQTNPRRSPNTFGGETEGCCFRFDLQMKWFRIRDGND